MSSSQHPAPAPAPQQASPSLLLFMAIACGLCAGCNYINQPLLHSIAADLHVSEARAAFSVTLSQLSYAFGLPLLVPLGDLLDRKRLVVGLMLVASMGLFLCAFTGDIWLFWAGTVIAGLFSVAAQVLIPLVTLLVAPQQAGRAVGLLMSGLLIGVQTARSVAGILSATAGWQSVYWLTAALMIVVAAILWRRLPQTAQAPAQNDYWANMRSMGRLFVELPSLRSRTWLGAASFGSMSVLFSTMALLLGAAPHKLNDMSIGLISLVGVAAALMAQKAGQWADQGKEPATTRLSVGLLLLSWPVLLLGIYSVTLFALGLLLIGVAVSAVHISNQSVLFRLVPAARSRINALYMFGYFVGASSGSALGVLAWELAGWPGVCGLGALLALLAALAWRHDRKIRPAESAPPSNG